MKGSYWIRLVFTHPFPLNSTAPIALLETSFQMQGSSILAIPLQTKPKTCCYGCIWDCSIIYTNNGPFPTNGGSVIQDQRVGTIQLLFQSDPLLTFSLPFCGALPLFRDFLLWIFYVISISLSCYYSFSSELIPQQAQDRLFYTCQF